MIIRLSNIIHWVVQQRVQIYNGIGNGNGNGNDLAWSIAVDNSNKVYVTSWSMGINSGYDIVTIKYSQTVGIEVTSLEIPNNFFLSQNYPNPFNPTTKINFDLLKQSFTKIIIYDVLGKKIETLVNQELKAGSYQVDWDASIYPSGVYFYKLIADGFTDTKKMVLLR